MMQFPSYDPLNFGERIFQFYRPDARRQSGRNYGYDFDTPDVGKTEIKYCNAIKSGCYRWAISDLQMRNAHRFVLMGLRKDRETKQIFLDVFDLPPSEVSRNRARCGMITVSVGMVFSLRWEKYRTTRRLA